MTMDPVMLPDPAQAAPYPVGLALEIALETSDLDTILETYSLTKEDFVKILKNPVFKKELEEHREAMKQEGWSFRKKASMQAELYLHKIYNLVHSDTTPANVKADLIKATVRWAGYEAPAIAAQAQGQAFDLGKAAEMLKSIPDGELELRVAQLVLRRAPQEPASAPIGVTYDA